MHTRTVFLTLFSVSRNDNYHDRRKKNVTFQLSQSEKERKRTFSF